MLTWMVIPSLLQIGCVCPPRTQVEILTPNIIALKSEGFGWWLGHESGILMNGISAVIKTDPREASLSPWHVTIQWENGGLQQWKRVFTRTWLCGHHDLRIPASRNIRNKLLLFISHQISGIVIAAEHTKTFSSLTFTLMCQNKKDKLFPLWTKMKYMNDNK